MPPISLDTLTQNDLNELILMLTKLTHYIDQMESSDPDALLNPVHLIPARGETMRDVELRNEALRKEALRIMAHFDQPFYSTLNYG